MDKLGLSVKRGKENHVKHKLLNIGIEYNAMEYVFFHQVEDHSFVC